jgi:two-component system NtrC family response regulator
VWQAADAQRGFEALHQHAAEVLVVLCDVKLPDAHGVTLLPRLRALAPVAEVILLMAYGTIADGVQAMKAHSIT